MSAPEKDIIRIDGQGNNQNRAGSYQIVYSGPADFAESFDGPSDFVPVGGNTVTDSLVVDPGDVFPNEFNKDWSRGPLPAQVTVTSGGPLRFVKNPANKNDRQGEQSFVVESGETVTFPAGNGGGNGGGGDGIGTSEIAAGLLLLGAVGAGAYALTRGRQQRGQRTRRTRSRR